ncbi:chromosomal replication initiator protein DnaA [Granulibacter bethesdensis]|uniref:Chromosomal replication initiator protein DnaA n=1 Tax=Granulibacter bethesdensis (strain ATCC BAA-1260 / CGDNIH1) TaxID=391165 RepID=Q0BVU3_GRABC|nr:Chromosomal replication initiator protein DNAA [Granulibacter bethesdensis CGDNIH1]AHJ67149.1 Chromosomal replication initiator protein DNAA [Granulibacter bethesdensis]APH50833.1 Chromosomal replication initiator protein DNAA [Granulibacter bethesdensis]APH63527.1 Chromosomal replication initiator protein DNAA [Granulibacter bethesdensis]
MRAVSEHGGSAEQDISVHAAKKRDDFADVTPATGRPVSAGLLAEQWNRVRQRLRAEVGEVEYRTWLRQMTLAGLEADEVAIHLPTRFLRDWVRSHYSDRLNTLWQAENPAVRRVDIRLGSVTESGHGLTESLYESGIVQKASAPAERVAPVSSVADQASLPEADTLAPSSLAGPALDEAGRAGDMHALDRRFSFETFVVGKPNEFAYACARRVAESPASPGFNPLFLYGGVGLGKTHLMHAIAWELNRPGRPPVSVAYMSAEKFMYRFIAAIRSQSTMEFKEELRSVDVLMVDDLQFLIGKDNTQEEFFHTFNALVDAGKQIVVSADKSPSDLSGLEDRLRTRLGCGMVADLHATTFELRISILEAKVQKAGVEVSPKVLEFLAHKITSNVRELEGALNRLIAHANLFGRALTLETAQEVLHDILKAHDRRITIEEIQRRVAEHWNIRLTDMSSARRARAVARPRQVAMFLAKQLTSRSLPEIGRKFGNRDHTTVMHAISRVTELMERDAAFAEDVELLRRMLES